jgi:Flp pilus assembly protein protease CpaA
MNQMVILPILLVWLLICMIYDLKYRAVPDKLTLYPLVIAGIYGLYQHQWMPVLLLPALILISDWEPRSRRLLFAFVLTAFAAIFVPATALSVFILFTIWYIWEIGAMGGADAKLLMVITLVIGSPNVFALVALAGGIQGLVGLLTHKRSVPYIAAIFVGTMLSAVNQLWIHLL